MTVTLETFSSGDTNYITKHNTNVGRIGTAINSLQQDVDGLKAAGSPGGDLDYRLIAFNLLLNGTFDYFQRGANERPDGWEVENDGAGFQVVKETSEIKLNTNSVKMVNTGQLTQTLESKIRANLDSGFSLSFGVYVKTDTIDKVRIGINDGITTSWGSYHSGDDSWEYHTINYVQGSNPATTIKFILDCGSGTTAYFNSACVIRGNPNSGPSPVANDPILEKLRVLSYYETGFAFIQGVGYLDATYNKRQIRERVCFSVPKSSVPTVILPNALDKIETGEDLFTENIDERGFDLVYEDLGNNTGTNGIRIEGIRFIAEV